MAVAHSTTATGSPLIGASDWNTAHTVDNGSFVAAKLSATATDKVFGRSSSGAGNGEEIALTAAGRALIDDADAAAQRVTLGIPTLARTEALLGADVTLTTGGDYYDGPTITPAAGVYDVWARITFFAGGTGNRGFTGRLIANGSATPIDMAEVDAPSASGNMYPLYLSARVTANGTDPILVRGSSATSTVDAMSRDPQSNTPLTLHRATILVITKVG